MGARRSWPFFIGTLVILAWIGMAARAQENAQENAPKNPDEAGTTRVRLVMTDAALHLGEELPSLSASDLAVTQGDKILTVTQLLPAQNENAAFQLLILIDDTLDAAIGNSLNELKDFVRAQPPKASIAVGYMSNTAATIAQDFTDDHDLAANAIRLPQGRLSTMDSPYLSLISVIKGWPQQKTRRLVLMVTDGIDRLHGDSPDSLVRGPIYGSVYHSMPAMSRDVDYASEVSQRFNVAVSSLYAVGLGRAARTSWDLQIGLSGLTKLADETGGECYCLSPSQIVSFKPYLDRFQKVLTNQYYVEFLAIPGKKSGFQRVKIQTELPNSEILAPDNVWVPVAPK